MQIVQYWLVTALLFLWLIGERWSSSHMNICNIEGPAFESYVYLVYQGPHVIAYSPVYNLQVQGRIKRDTRSLRMQSIKNVGLGSGPLAGSDMLDNMTVAPVRKVPRCIPRCSKPRTDGRRHRKPTSFRRLGFRNRVLV